MYTENPDQPPIDRDCVRYEETEKALRKPLGGLEELWESSGKAYYAKSPDQPPLRPLCLCIYGGRSQVRANQGDSILRGFRTVDYTLPYSSRHPGEVSEGGLGGGGTRKGKARRPQGEKRNLGAP